MGSSMSYIKGADEEDRKRRQNLEDELNKMENSLKVTATSHYISSEYYGRWDHKLQYASYLTGALGTTGGTLYKLARKEIVKNNPRLAPILAASTAISFLFTAAVNIPHFPNLPCTLHQLHFRSGIECQYLEKQVRFFAKADVWNYNVPWTTLASRYENLLKRKKEINSRVKSEDWAYREASKRRETRNVEKQQKENEKSKLASVI